ncbi:DUF434 domain-containing protein [Papillibacter cinnamivorans]|uniref:DUF434 domain-containing protein n=1 Tax=Papillibacter cinnamivorans DSM 12816 TaxID=1122930 RepID=A0A1W2AT39_9FIRM|nr:DUF434 domain-containing protein [Papillibacter cinnamivorans]SMC63899.1 hypothetical protein SAMN02745168_1946 [Papillibacter cinnamivorans DSM 12816]
MGMEKAKKRGYSPEDEREFAPPALKTLRRAAGELCFLLNRGYPMKAASTFVGNHYLLSQRQRVALTRYAAPERNIALRKAKQVDPMTLAGGTVHIDGFNEIITLEVAQSGAPVFRCMDGTFRDLAGLRGTYRLIGKTDIAVRLVLSRLKKYAVKKAVFWLDAPVSNSGALKVRIAEIAEEMNFDAETELSGSVDKTLCDLPNVITGDSVILDRCSGWLNLNEEMIPGIPEAWIIDLTEREL